MRIRGWYFMLALSPAILRAQQSSDLQQILERMDRLENQNRVLAEEVRALRAVLAMDHPAPPEATAVQEKSAPANTKQEPSQPPTEERVATVERQVEDLAQTKVQSSQRLPVTLTGMILFNAFLNSRANGGQQDPVVASPSNNPSGSGASLSQSIIGFAFQGPRIFGDGRVNGDLRLDLWGGSTSSLNHLVRLRVATIRMDWKNQSLIVGQDKPIISPRDPSSFAQVAFSPLTSAGNPWLWGPQARFEQRFAWGDNTGMNAQAGVYETSEPVASAGPDASTLTTARPALEGRFMLWRNLGRGRRIEIAPGFHVSQTHIAGLSIPSRLFTTDWLIQPTNKLQWTGMFFNGENAAGIGALRQGFTVFSNGIIRPVGTAGGWTQLSYFLTNRITLNVYGGQESNRPSDLLGGQITRNLAYAGNISYRLAPNILLGVEASQVRTKYLDLLSRRANHYDLSLAYLF